MEKVILFGISFLTIYLLYLFTVVLQKRKMEKFKKSVQVQFFVKRYGLSFQKISIEHFAHLLALANAFIVAFTLTVTDFIGNFLLKMLVAFVVLFPTILLIYALIGVYIQKKEGKLCVKSKK